MKLNAFVPFILAVSLLGSCGASKAGKNDDQRTNNSSAAKKADAGNDAIVGAWEMVGVVTDTNGNLQIDEAERKSLKKGMTNYMKLNRDGSGEFTVAKMEGRYETTGSEGKKTLTWFDRANGRHRMGTIVKVTTDELHIKEPGGNGLFIWKRL